MIKIYFFFLCFITFANAQDFRKDTIELNETILYDKSKFRLKRVGPESKSKSICMKFNTIKDSIEWKKPQVESYTFINSPKKEFTIKAINLNFSFPPKEETLFINLKLYKSSKNEPIDSVFFEKNNIKILPNDIVDQVFTIDLSNENLIYNNEFYIGLQSIKKLKDEFVCLGGVIFSKGYSKNLTTGTGFDKNPLGAKLSINADILIKR